MLSIYVGLNSLLSHISLLILILFSDSFTDKWNPRVASYVIPAISSQLIFNVSVFSVIAGLTGTPVGVSQVLAGGLPYPLPGWICAWNIRTRNIKWFTCNFQSIKVIKLYYWLSCSVEHAGTIMMHLYNCEYSLPFENSVNMSPSTLDSIETNWLPSLFLQKL